MILSVLSSLALVSGLMVVRAKNPVHSVLFPIPVFRNTSGLLLLLGLDFFAMIFPVVHIGAIAVSFLFVVMMFHIQIAEIHEEVLRYLPVSGIIGLIFWWEMFFILDNESIPLLPTQRNTTSLRYMVYAGKVRSWTNLETLGNLLYTYYSVWFLVPSLILLVAMIGAIVLTMHRTTKVKRQDVFRRNAIDSRRTIMRGMTDLLKESESIRQDGRVITTLAFVLEFPLASLTSLSLALPPFTTMAVSLSTGARIRLKVGSRFLVESIGSSIRADLLNASAVQSSAADGLVVADGLLLAIESTLTARVDGLLGDPSMLSPIITSNYIQESHLPDVVSGPGVGCGKAGANARKGGVVRPLLLQLRNYLVVRGNSNPRLLHSPKPQNRHLAEALGGEGVSLLVYPRLIGNGKPGECYQLPLLPRWKAYELD
ncbi:hypothetical protein L1987_89463 [Smallanthus sonchifolius]|nr:hypothetical protein L1987_89463 [Smallanthus sonchifolius]